MNPMIATKGRTERTTNDRTIRTPAERLDAIWRYSSRRVKW